MLIPLSRHSDLGMSHNCGSEVVPSSHKILAVSLTEEPCISVQSNIRKIESFSKLIAIDSYNSIAPINNWIWLRIRINPQIETTDDACKATFPQNLSTVSFEGLISIFHSLSALSHH
jgi:hypothetical protein